MPPNSRRRQPPLALAVPLSRFTPRVGGGSAFYVDMADSPTLMKTTLILVSAAVVMLLAGFAIGYHNGARDNETRWQSMVRVDPDGRFVLKEPPQPRGNGHQNSYPAVPPTK